MAGISTHILNAALGKPAVGVSVELLQETSQGYFSIDKQLTDVDGLYLNFSVHDKFHRALVLSGFFFLKIASTFLNSSFFPKPIKRRIAI